MDANSTAAKRGARVKSFIVKCLFSNQWVAPNNKRTWHKHEAKKFGELEDWKNKIYQQHVADYNDFIAFLSARCVSAHAHTTSRVQLLI